MKAIREALVNVPDETGWKVGGDLEWMHVTVSAQVTVYAILPGRGYEQSVLLLGADYAGFLVHDGWAPYYRFLQAFHQSCLRHLLTRCQEMARLACPTAARYPLAVQDPLGVTEIARTICELLRWKRPGGGLKNHECRQLLEQLLGPDKMAPFWPVLVAPGGGAGG